MKRGWRDLQVFVDPSWLDVPPRRQGRLGITVYSMDTLVLQSFGRSPAEPPMTVPCSTHPERRTVAHLRRVLSRLDIDQPAPSRGVSSMIASSTQSAFLIWLSSGSHNTHTLICSMSISVCPGRIMQDPGRMAKT